MKKDILKEFVSENFESFNDQHPGPDVLGSIRSRLNLDQPTSAPRQKVIRFQYWWAAATLIFGLAGIAYYYQSSVTETTLASKAKSSIPSLAEATEDANTHPILSALQHSPSKPVKRSKSQIKSPVVPKIKTPAASLATHDLPAELHSKSSSARLAAVLALGKRLDLLAETDLYTLIDILNTDENSNVRLAALDALKETQSQDQVKSLILKSISKQSDPYVQIELLASLSSEQAAQVKEQLVDLTRDTVSIGAVRDQAYAALLRSNVNF